MRDRGRRWVKRVKDCGRWIWVIIERREGEG
jgi:hypothetical protein